MNLKFFSAKEAEYQSAVRFQELKGTFTDRMIDRLNRAYDESQKQFDSQQKRSKVQGTAS